MQIKGLQVRISKLRHLDSSNVFFYKLVSDFIPSSLQNGCLYVISLGSDA